MNLKFLRRFFNRPLHLLAMISPGAATIRPLLHKLRGVKIHGKVWIGDQAYIENEYPECVEINDRAAIGIRTMILAHMHGPGKVIIGKNVFIGPNCVIITTKDRTLKIGDNSFIAASCVITSNIPPDTYIGREKSKPLAEITIPYGWQTDYYDFIGGLKKISKKKNE